MTDTAMQDTDSGSAEAPSLLNVELDTLNGFQLKAEVIRREAECKRLRKALDKKEDIFLRLLSLTEELKTKTIECVQLKRKIKNVEDEARNVFKVSNGQIKVGGVNRPEE